MAELIELIAESGELVQARLNQMQDRHLQDFEIIWREMLFNLGQDDAVWNWAMKKRLSVLDERFEAYAIGLRPHFVNEYDGMTQGLIWLETQWHRSWLTPDQRLVYVEALAVAPWNRRDLQYPPYLKGTGNSLMLFARERSLALGYQGRVGLHSLPTSETFYHHQNMSDYGEDPDKENLRYFEFGIWEQSGR
jgi:hypothetical protein